MRQRALAAALDDMEAWLVKGDMLPSPQRLPYFV